MDILVNNDGRWQAYEVKASTSPKEYHYTDISFQYYVIRASGLDLAEISLMHLNTKYVRRGELDVKQLKTPPPKSKQDLNARTLTPAISMASVIRRR
jgi:hypothetical protein